MRAIDTAIAGVRTRRRPHLRQYSASGMNLKQLDFLRNGLDIHFRSA